MLDPRVLRRASGFLLFIAVMAFYSGAVAKAGVVPPTLPENLVPGDAVTRTIWKNDLLFLFEGKTGEVITLKVTSRTSGLDPHVSLIDPESLEEASDDDSGKHGNSLLKDHILKRTGVYIVIVGSDGTVQGKVRVLLKKAPPSPPPLH